MRTGSNLHSNGLFMAAHFVIVSFELLVKILSGCASLDLVVREPESVVIVRIQRGCLQSAFPVPVTIRTTTVLVTVKSLCYWRTWHRAADVSIIIISSQLALTGHRVFI